MLSVFISKTLAKMKMVWQLLLFAFILRLLVPLFAFIHSQTFRNFHDPDTAEYVNSAIGLITSGRFTNPYLGGTPQIFRTPGYPLLLIPGILLNNLELVTISLQIILSCLTVYLVYQIALLLFKKVKIAALCAFLYAIEPVAIFYTSQLLSETLFTSVFTLFLYYFLKYLNSRTLKHLLISSITLAASAYVRPISYYLPLLLTGFLLIWLLKVENKKTLIIHTCIFLTISMGLIGCWQIRNQVVAGYPKFSAVTDVNLYSYNAASLLAEQKGITLEAMQKQMGRGFPDNQDYFIVHPEQRTWTESARYEYMRQQGKKIIAADPVTYFIIHLKGMLKVIITPGAHEYESLFGYENTSVNLQKEPLLFCLKLAIGLILCLYILGTSIGLIAGFRLNNLSLMMLLSTSFYLLVVSGGPVGYSRFRHPLMPIICILAGHGLSVIFDRLPSTKQQLKKGVF